jgi:Domain of unknown function (DUF4430)
MASPSRASALLALVAAALLAGGCGLGAGKTPTGVRLEITRGFGAQVLRSLPAPHVQGQETVMSLLLRNAKIETRYGGGFVESIDGHSNGYEDGEPIGWFYYVNGVQAPRGAAETNVEQGDRVWWDLHDWSQTEEAPAVVGSFPEPFLNGVGGRRLPVRIECAVPAGDPCRTVFARLHAASVTSTLTSLGARALEALRVLVGTWAQVRRDPGARSLERGPRLSGVYALVRSDGKAIALLDAQGEVARTLTGSAGLVAATRSSGGPPEWIITGTNAAGLDQAAHAIEESTLHDRFAVALTGSGAVLPLPQPGA